VDDIEQGVPSEGRQFGTTVITMEEIPLRIVYILEAPGSGTTGGNVAERNYPVS
jgi:hypothetical protein